MKDQAAAETKIASETESGDDDSSTEDLETESPRSLVGAKKKLNRWVHSQVLKIREEDSHLGEYIVNGGGSILHAEKEGKNVAISPNDGGDVVLVTRPVLPCSPLSGRTRVGLQDHRLLH